ncbi:MAG: nucleotidyltransferase domain-containing protein [Clostridia bacterium]|nr:nucleotidyltransferase domain-containing protein [Clostridia bacterium]
MQGDNKKHFRTTTMDQREAIKKVQAYKALLEDNLKFDKIYLFGSYANNTQHEDSDVDVAIVVSEVKGDFFSVNPMLWTLRRKIDDRIEPILIEKDNDHAGFLTEIEANGIEIT